MVELISSSLRPAVFIILSAASVFFAAKFEKNGKISAVKLIAVLVSGILAAVFSEGMLAMGLSVIIGQLFCLAVNFIFGKGRNILPEACLYLCFDAACLPILLASDYIFQYSLYLGIAVFIFSFSFYQSDAAFFSPTAFLPENKAAYIKLSLFPCLSLIPNAAASFILREENELVSAIGSLVLFFILAVFIELRQEFEKRIRCEEIISAMHRWQSESRDYMNTIRSQRHDFNLHLHAISGLVNSGEYKKCGEYVNKLVADANAVNDIMPVSDAVVGSMLFNMREEARRRGSEITYNITYDMEDVFCNGFELNKIIGNLLQNAIDAMRTEEDKAFGIKLSIFRRRGNTVIVSENRFTGDPERIARVFEPGYSTKRGHEGIGLSMALRTAEKYGGRVYPEFEKDVIRFVVNIPNRVNLKEGD